MKKIIVLLFSLILVGCSCKTLPPEPITPAPFTFRAAPLQKKGIDTLAAPKFKKELRAIPNEYCTSCFAQTFGDCLPVVKDEMARGRSCMRVNLMWSDTHTYGNKDIKTIAKEAKRYDPVCRQYPNKIELAPFTEHNISSPDQFLMVVKANAPNCGAVVNSVWKGGYTKSSSFKNEVHGTHSAPKVPDVPYNYSYDGTNSVDSDVTKMLSTHAGADAFYMWQPRLNGKWSMKDTTPRPERKAWPTVELLKSLVYLFTDKGPYSIPKGWTVKSHAEKHGVTDTKGDKLLIISPVRADKIDLKRNGKTVCTLRYFGPYDAGGYRYYADRMGYQCGANLGVFIGKKQYGIINGGFRSAPYR